MVRRATMQDVSRKAEIIVFGKRVAYSPIFNNDLVSFNEIRVIDIIERYQNDPQLISEFYEANGFRESGETSIIEGTSKLDICYELMLK